MNGWRLTGWIAAAAGLAVVVSLAAYGVAEEGLRVGIRLTARLGVLVFLLAFVARPANALWPSPVTKWLLRNRRHVGVGFAAIHALHGVLIVVLAARYPESFWATTSMVSVAGGSLGYVWLGAMVATSFDASAAAIGRTAWKILHTSGMYVLWGIFAFSYFGGVTFHPLYAVLFALLMAALGLRVVARLRRRSR